MTKLATTICAVALAVSAGQANAAACMDGKIDLAAEFASSDYVAKGKVVGIDHDQRVTYDYKGKTYSDLVDRVAIRVQENFKRPSNSVIYFDNTQDSASFPVEIGKSYLFFLARSSPADPLHVDSCGSSTELRGSGLITLSRIKRLSADEVRRSNGSREPLR